MKQPSLSREQITGSSKTRQPGKKVYRTPRLTSYGALLDLTQATGGVGTRDRFGPPPNRFSR